MTSRQYPHFQKLTVGQSILAARSREEAFVDICLPAIKRNGGLRVGRKIETIDQLAREQLALIILSHLGHHITGEDWLPATDPYGHDGAIVLKDSAGISTGIIIESTYIHELADGSLDDLVKERINSKNARGTAYTDGTNLVVYVDKTGPVDLTASMEVAESSSYTEVYLIGQDTGPFSYRVVFLKSNGTIPAPAQFVVTIDPQNGHAGVADA